MENEAQIHVTQAAHEAAKKYCKENGLTVKMWVSELILTNTETKKKLEGIKNDPDGADAWTRPPFWAGRK